VKTEVDFYTGIRVLVAWVTRRVETSKINRKSIMGTRLKRQIRICIALLFLNRGTQLNVTRGSMTHIIYPGQNSRSLSSKETSDSNSGITTSVGRVQGDFIRGDLDKISIRPYYAQKCCVTALIYVL